MWRLISVNHQELIRGLGMFPGYAHAAAHADSARDITPSLTVTLMRYSGTGKVGWYALPRSRPVMLAAAGQRTARERDREDNILATAARHGHRRLTGSAHTDFPHGQLP